MAVKKNTRREGILIDAINPEDGKKIQVQISYRRLQIVTKRTQGQILDCGKNVPKVLQTPTAIFDGLCEDADEEHCSRGSGWRCYCGKPDCSYSRDGKPCPPYQGQVFLVFVNHERVAYNWYWAECDPQNPDLPENWKIRFKKRTL